MIIDTDNYEASGIKLIWFSGGEPHVTTPETFPFKHANIYAKIRNANDLIGLLEVASAMTHRGVERIHVFMPYFPGARQDRVQAGGGFTVEVYAQMLAASPIKTITVADIHSVDALHVISNKFIRPGLRQSIKVLPLTTFIGDLITEEYDMVIAPDKGAVGRAEEVASALGIKRVEYATKTRDPNNGKLTLTSVPSLPEKVVNVLIPDDICDGGWTFTNLAEQLRKVNRYTSVRSSLYVTHGIFSQGFEKLNQNFLRIYTTNSFYNKGEQPDLRVLDLTPYYMESLQP